MAGKRTGGDLRQALVVDLLLLLVRAVDGELAVELERRDAESDGPNDHLGHCGGGAGMEGVTVGYGGEIARVWLR